MATTAITNDNIDADREIPSRCRDSFWIYHYKERTIDAKEEDMKTFLDAEPDDVIESGKWMLFYPTKHALDVAWIRAKRAMNSGDFPRTQAMKVSTALKNPNAASPDDGGDGVLIVYSDGFRHQIEKDGIRIAEVMKYASSNGRMYFKSDELTYSGMYSKNGVRSSTFSIAVPRLIARFPELDQ